MKTVLILLLLGYTLETAAGSSESSKPAAELVTAHLDRAVASAEKAPMTDAKATLLINIASLRLEIDPATTNLIPFLEPVLEQFSSSNRTGDYLESDYVAVDIQRLIDLYLRMDSLPHAERALGLQFVSDFEIYSLSEMACYSIRRKDLATFARFHSALQRLAGKKSDQTTTVSPFVRIAECLATNSFSAESKKVFAEAQKMAVNAPKLDITEKLDLVPFGEITKSPLKTWKDARAAWSEAEDRRLNSFIYYLLDIGYAQRRSGFSSDALENLRRSHDFLRQISSDGREFTFPMVLSFALELDQFEFAEAMLKLTNSEGRSEALCSLAVAEIRIGRIDKGLRRFDALPEDVRAEDYSLPRLAVDFAEAHRFQDAEPLLSRINPDLLQEMVFPSLVTNLVHAGKPDLARQYLARIEASTHRSELEELLPKLTVKPPRSLSEPRDSGVFVCGFSGSIIQQFADRIRTSPENLLMELESTRKRSPAKGYNTIREIGQEVAKDPTRFLSFWTTRLSDPLDRAFLYLGLAEGTRSAL